MMNYYSTSSSAALLLLVFLSMQRVSGAPLTTNDGGIARNVRSELILVNRDQPARFPRRINQGNFNPKDVPVGEALDLFYRFGFFSLSVRVVPRDDAGTWLVREPTATIFETQAKDVSEGENAFESDFQVYLCDDEAELMEAYFKDFTAEGVEEPHKLYTGSWHSSTKAKYFGLDKSVFDGDSSFVLVRLQKRHAVVSAPRHPKLKQTVAKELNGLNSEDKVLEFTRRYGSHYVDEVSVGESLYQVYALNRPQYEQAKRALSGRRSLSGEEFRAVRSQALAPWNVRQAGTPQAASGNEKLASLLASERVTVEGKFGRYPDLMVVGDDAGVAAEVEEISRQSSAEAIIGLNFASMRRFVPEGRPRQVYDAELGTNAILWEANI